MQRFLNTLRPWVWAESPWCGSSEQTLCSLFALQSRPAYSALQPSPPFLARPSGPLRRGWHTNTQWSVCPRGLTQRACPPVCVCGCDFRFETEKRKKTSKTTEASFLFLPERSGGWRQGCLLLLLLLRFLLCCSVWQTDYDYCNVQNHSDAQHFSNNTSSALSPGRSRAE